MSLTTYIVINNAGILKEQKSKEFNEDSLYKKCGFKLSTGFVKQVTWHINVENVVHNISLYAKSDGKANYENKYDFPPPVDSVLLFGSCMLLNRNNENNVVDLPISLWKLIYEKLFGGFEDITKDETEEDDEDELKDVPKKMLTKDGYLKDNFVVEGSDEESENGDSKDGSDESEEEDVIVQKKEPVSSVVKRKKAVANPKKTLEEKVSVIIEDEEDGSELSEDSYDYEEENPTF